MTKNATTLCEPETFEVTTHSVSCDGGAKHAQIQGSANGHPKVFMDMGQMDSVDCKYCGKRFVLKAEF